MYNIGCCQHVGAQGSTPAAVPATSGLPPFPCRRWPTPPYVHLLLCGYDMYVALRCSRLCKKHNAVSIAIKAGTD